MNRKRLLKLADLLEADAKNKKGIKFDLGNWGNSYNSENENEFVSHSCGTTACAVGLAVVSGAFKRIGLKNLYGDTSARICPEFDGGSGFDAVMRLFDITPNTAEFLFLDERYPASKRIGATGERFVAKRIRDFVAGKVTP